MVMMTDSELRSGCLALVTTRKVVHKAFCLVRETSEFTVVMKEHAESSESSKNALESDHSSACAESRCGENGVSVTTRATKKPRKSMDDRRKEEKMQLIEEISKLEARLAFLSQQAVSDVGKTVLSVEGANMLLRERLQQQQLRLATSRAVVSQAIISNVASSLPTRIVLSRDRMERHRVLSEMEAEQLAVGRQYITERSRFLDLSESHHTMEDVVSSEGDILNDRFIVVQYEQQSVRNVFDTILYYGANVEFVMSESDDCVTIREDADDDNKTAPGITQHVLQVTMAPGVVAEHNTVMFSEYDAHEDVGLIVARFVDEDELHPYKPLERIRHDLKMVGIFSKLPDTDTVVVRFWGHLRWHRSKHVVVEDEVMRQLRPKLNEWTETIPRLVRMRLASGNS